MLGEVGPGSGRRHPARAQRGRPRFGTGGKREPGCGIRLDHVRWGAAGVTGALNRLHGTEWRHPHFNRVARRLLCEQLQQVADGRRRRLSARSGAQRGPDACLTDIIRNSCPSHAMTVSRCS
jgi:hypothetical protein